ncbi:uncharacterized protein LOC103573762 [Microplitis demolitor]|uniref:uncharacterized protein LOC103573762 n=1 Tax=Microplitis demolitor TaxID=69319 RepID=UPI0006D51B3D|nr:uncharacterized protein LOC103573762 [Microplitis demolitor]
MKTLTIIAILNVEISLLSVQLSTQVDLNEDCNLQTGASMEASASGEGANVGVEGQANLPSCECLRRLDIKGSASVSANGMNAKGGVSQSSTVVVPGVNCMEEGTSKDETDQEYKYIVDIERTDIVTPGNSYLYTHYDKDEDTYGTYWETMEAGNDLKIYLAKMYADDDVVYESKDGDKMKPLCDNSYPEKSAEANVWKILNLLVMDGQDCPIQEGTNYTLPLKLSSVELTFNEPIPCGEYSLNIYLDSPKDNFALGVHLAWDIEKGSTKCTDETHEL